ncbi:MAG: helix-turn-helix domain-containing protein [Hyphomicrobiales bacterium]|nr:helix-turn-helix domain-containing protein [Hyphomicrobiales bacterium]
MGNARTIVIETADNRGSTLVPMSAGEKIKQARVARGLSQAQLGVLVGISQPAVRKIESGRTEKSKHLPRIARVLELELSELDPDLARMPIAGMDPDEAVGPTVRVVGYVGAGSEAHFYAVAQGDMDEVPAPEGSTKDTVAVEIRGDSLGSLFDRWLVFYDEVRRPITSDMIGRLCVVGLADDRVLIKKVRRGRNGLYTLVSEREPPIENVAIEWAARVKNMVPR